jgi:hypothetical protein
MAFTVPDFNLTVSLWTGPWPYGPLSRRGDIMGNLTLGRRIQTMFSIGSPTHGLQGYSFLLVPAGTDIRDSASASGYDIVEVPQGTNRFYVVAFVDDVAKGFSNEYRQCSLVKAAAIVDSVEFPGVHWPTPIP